MCVCVSYTHDNVFIATVDFSIMVLSSGSWPFTQGPVFSLPAEVSVCTCVLYNVI